MGTTEEDGPKRLPYILAGDFNLLPDSPHYRLLTEGKLDPEDETYPDTKYVWNGKSMIISKLCEVPILCRMVQNQILPIMPKSRRMNLLLEHWITYSYHQSGRYQE